MRHQKQFKPFPVVKTVEEARVILMSGCGCGVDMTGLPDEEVERRLTELEKIVGFGKRRRTTNTVAELKRERQDDQV